MSEKSEKQAISALAGEVMQALAEAAQMKGGFNQDNFSQALARRESIMDMVQKVCQEQGLDVAKDDKDLSYENLRKKYQELSEELRHSDGRLVEIEDAFKKLTATLATLASDPALPNLDRELKMLRQVLRQKIVPGRLDAATRNLKNFVMHAGGAAAFAESEPEEGGAEGLEENVRDILILLVRDISVMEDEETRKRAKVIARKIRNEFTLEDYEPFIHDIHDLLFHIKDFIRQEKKKLYDFSREIISRLEETEQDLLRNLDTAAVRLGVVEEEFELRVDGDMREIETSFDEGLPVERVRVRVMEKITNIRRHFKLKKAEDDARLKQLADEKEGVERRLRDINQNYQEFALKSKALIEEVEKFRQASLQDGLTGAFNRRAYDLHIRKAVEEHKAGRLGTFSLIVFDVDRFKDFNNKYGHRAGDKTLLYVAKFSREHMRQEDLLFRYGGDEFAILLPEADLKTAARVAGSIRSGLNAVEFKIFKESSVTTRVSLSMGVSQGRFDDDPVTVFNRADQALYLAKEKGRNQVRTEKEVK